MNTPQPANTRPADLQQPESSYLGYLPAIFRQDSFLGRFLLAFETMLTGTDGWPADWPADQPAAQQAGLETTIGHVADYLDPMTTRADFLPWLAGWVALSLRADWDVSTQRAFIRQIVSLYKLRGTKGGLQQMLEVYTQKPVEIWDTFDDRPYFFEVRLTLSVADTALLDAKRQIARAIIDQEKPAHTYYALQIAIPTMRLVSEALHERTNAPMLFLRKNKPVPDDGVAALLGTKPSP